MILVCLDEAYADYPQLNERKELTGNITVKFRKHPIPVRISVEPEQIGVHREDFDKRGRIYKDRCIANIAGFGNLILRHSFNEIEEIKRKTGKSLTITGFKRETNEKKGRNSDKVGIQ